MKIARRRSASSLSILAMGAVFFADLSVGLSAGNNALQKCAAVDLDAERLQCYDKLAGRTSVPQSASAESSTRGESPPSSSSALVPPESFGLYEAENPRRPVQKAAAEHVTVLAIGTNANGQETVTLDGNQVWVLGDNDPLLAPGDSVTVTRSSLGSFMMTTPTGREHRLKRLR